MNTPLRPRSIRNCRRNTTSIQEKLNRLGPPPEPRPSFEIDPRQTQRNDRPKKGNSGCLKPIGILMAVLILFNVIIPLIFGALKYVLFDRPSPTPEPVYPASESVIADEYVDGIPGYSYTVNDMNFIVGDMALLDTGDALDPEQAVVLVQTDAFCDLPVDEYAQVSVSTYLSDAGGAYYYSPIDMAAYEEDSLAQTLFNNYQFYFLQDFELSYLDWIRRSIRLYALPGGSFRTGKSLLCAPARLL